jgi:hypothetical protein
MSIKIDLTPEEVDRLHEAASREGLPPAALARRFVTERLACHPEEPTPEDPMLALFAEWDEEDAVLTAEAVAEERQRWEELKASINDARNRAGARRAF